MRRSFLAAAVIPVIAFAAITFGSTKEAAASGTTLDLDLNLGTAFQSQGVSQVDFSAGGGARLGYRFNIPQSMVYVQPEGGIHYMRFGFNSASLGYDYAVTVNGGLKAGLSGIVQPNVFGHLGVGALGYSIGQNISQGYVGPAMDIGAGLDFRLAPGFLLGAQIAYNSVLVPSAGSPDAAKWVTFGLTAGFHFGDAPQRRVVYVRRGY
jgi:hypothetical protein